jgi:hypothetical protein
MPDETDIREFIDAFNAQGFVRLEPYEISIQWALEAEILASEKIKDSVPKEPGWHDLTIELGMPQHELLIGLLKALLTFEVQPPSWAQLSTLVNGFDRELKQHHRHVDGYYCPPGKTAPELAWHALLIGIPIVALPEQGEAGNPLVWPGSHRLTRQAFESLSSSPTSDEVGQKIRSIPTVGKPMQHLRLHGPAGTIFVIDHDLHHGMMPHRTPGMDRHIAYYRIPEAISDPNHVVNRAHFFR